MDHVTDSEACSDCGHDHYPYGGYVTRYSERRDECGEPGCDCESYVAPDRPPKVYKCSLCGRMVTRVWLSCWGGGYECDECRDDE